MEALSATASVISVLDTSAKIAKLLSLSRFQDTKVHELGLELRETANEVRILLSSITSDKDENQRRRVRVMMEILMDINSKMEQLVKKDDQSFGSRLKRPWYRKQMADLRQRLDGVRRDVQTELVLAERTAFQNRGTGTGPDADELPSYDSLLGAANDGELPIMEDKVGDVFENLMRPRRRSTIEQPSNNSGASLPDDHEHIPDQSTGIGRTPSGLAQRRPWRPIEHQDVDLPVRMPVMREARVNFRVLRSTMAIWMINRVIVYAVFVALIVGSAVTAGLAAWKAQTESSSRQPKLSYDDNFYGSISQGLGSILGVFCIVIPLVERNRELQPDIPVWCPQTFRWLLGFSVVTAVFSMATQRFEEVESIVFGYVSMATQLVATMLLVVGSTETITQRQRAFDQLSTKHLIISGALQNVRQQAAANAAAL